MQDAFKVDENRKVTVDTQIVNPEVASFDQLQHTQKHSESAKEPRGLRFGFRLALLNVLLPGVVSPAEDLSRGKRDRRPGGIEEREQAHKLVCAAQVLRLVDDPAATGECQDSYRSPIIVAIAEVPLDGDKRAGRRTSEQRLLQHRKVTPNPGQNFQRVLLPLADRGANNEIKSGETTEAFHPGAAAKVPYRIGTGGILELKCCSAGQQNTRDELSCEGNQNFRVQERVTIPDLIPVEQLPRRVQERAGPDRGGIFVDRAARLPLRQRAYCPDQTVSPRRETLIVDNSRRSEGSHHIRMAQIRNRQKLRFTMRRSATNRFDPPSRRLDSRWIAACSMKGRVPQSQERGGAAGDSHRPIHFARAQSDDWF
jgi:hypothetical protein